MPALTPGKQAPNFALTTSDGNLFSLDEALARGPVVLAFFKVSCPVCQYAFPYFDRLYKALKGRGITLIGISQDNARDTADFVKTFRLTLPIALEPAPYPVSAAYDLTNVPTLFEIDPDGKIVTSFVGWDRAELESVYRHYSDGNATTPAPLFKAGENVADFKAG
jgi:peroxiredoxin